MRQMPDIPGPMMRMGLCVVMMGDGRIAGVSAGVGSWYRYCLEVLEIGEY